MLPMDLEADETVELGLLDDHEARFFTCHVCGDNWLSVRRQDHEDCQITFVHQMGLQPLLKRVAHMQTPIVLSEANVDRWDYLIGDEAVPEQEWRDELDERRHVLRACCSN